MPRCIAGGTLENWSVATAQRSWTPQLGCSNLLKKSRAGEEQRSWRQSCYTKNNASAQSTSITLNTLRTHSSEIGDVSTLQFAVQISHSVTSSSLYWKKHCASSGFQPLNMLSLLTKKTYYIYKLESLCNGRENSSKVSTCSVKIILAQLF